MIMQRDAVRAGRCGESGCRSACAGLLDSRTGGGPDTVAPAALAAATSDEVRHAGDMTNRARQYADRLDLGDDPYRTCFGPVAVELARVVVAVEAGDAAEAIGRHEVVMRREGWRRLPAEYRDAYLPDFARVPVGR
ncbi:hypothetical protein ACIBO1_08175 [Micromonospora sp. NPDC049903]|uniref:hypothetical protein n=1 Tax=Micromonospora sp. NPDC049903 TaxID=3364276 RepID=UPI00379D4DED